MNPRIISFFSGIVVDVLEHLLQSIFEIIK